MIEAKQAEQDRNLQAMDMLNGKLCAVIAEPYRDEKEHPDPFTAADFMIFKRPEQEPEEIPAEPPGMTEEQVRKSITTMKNWVAATGGTPNG